MQKYQIVQKMLKSAKNIKKIKKSKKNPNTFEKATFTFGSEIMG